MMSGKAQVTESFYLKQSQKLLQRIRKTTDEAADAVKNFDIQSNSDKICISTVGNNFARDLEYTLNNLQRVTIDNHQKGDDVKNLKEAVLAFSTFVNSIQLAFGNDFEKLKLAIINVLQNLDGKLDPLLDIVQEHSQYISKCEITNILDFLYIAIEKIKLRTQWEHFDRNELQTKFADILKTKLTYLDDINNYKDREDLLDHFFRTSLGILETIIHVIEEIDLDADHYDDEIRDLASYFTTKSANSIFFFDKAVRNLKNISEFLLYGKLTALNFIPTLKELLDILDNKNLQDVNGNIKNSILNAVINGLCGSLRFNKNWERIMED